jgi:GNAT superfamily N-acetyltransferase
LNRTCQQLGPIDLGCCLAAYCVCRVGSGQRCCWPLNADPLGGVVSVRIAVAADIPEIHRVRASVRENTLADYSVITHESIREHLEKLGRGWVYEADRRIVGIAIANRVDASVWALFVEPEFEGRGIGRALHDAMLAWLRSCGLRAVSLGTAPGTRAAGFYEAAGWKFREIDGSGEAVYELILA